MKSNSSKRLYLAMLLVSAGLFCNQNSGLYVTSLDDRKVDDLIQTFERNEIEPAIYVAVGTLSTRSSDKEAPKDGQIV